MEKTSDLLKEVSEQGTERGTYVDHRPIRVVVDAEKNVVSYENGAGFRVVGGRVMPTHSELD